MNKDRDINKMEMTCSTFYNEDIASDYLTKRERGLCKRLSNTREISIARQSLALAGHPQSVLDVPCGTGRFWPMLAESRTRQIYACDFSEPMIHTAIANRPGAVTERVNTVVGSVFEIPRENNSVENIFCMRFMHHVKTHEQRLSLMREFHRVASRSVCLSLWVDGNYKSYRRRKSNKKATSSDRRWNRYIVSPEVVEQEFRDAGFSIVGCLDFFRCYSMLRIYVLNREKIRVVL